MFMVSTRYNMFSFYTFVFLPLLLSLNMTHRHTLILLQIDLAITDFDVDEM